MKTYRVIYQRDETGWWVASVRGVRGCHTQGRTIRQARERIRDALGLFVKSAEKAKLTDEIRLPVEVRRKLAKHHALRRRIEQEQTKVQASTVDAARALTDKLGLSVRDAGELLELSHQRVQQLLQQRAS